MSAAGVRAAIFRAVNQRFFFGWTILGVAGLGILASGPGQSHTFSVFVGPIGEDLGLSGATIASAYGGATLAAALALPLMGRLVDRFGARRMLLIVAFALGLACFAFGAALNLVWLAFGFAALRFLGQGSLMLTCANLVSQWFSRKRGFALSLMSMGFAASIAVHPPLAQWLIESFGWRWAWLWIGLLTWALLLPPVLLLVHDKPEDLGVRPDGEAHGGAGGSPGLAASDVPGLTLRDALRTPAFYIVAAGLFSLSSLVTALFFFQVSIFSAHGLSAQTAAQLFPVSAVTMVLAMPAIGRLLDRLPTERMFAAGLLVMAATLASATLVEGFFSALAYAMVFGINNAANMTFFGFMWPRYFGRRHLGSIQGTGQMIAVVGASIGPLPFGLASDLFGSFNHALLGAALLPLACAVAALFLRQPAGLEALPGGSKEAQIKLR